MTEWLQEPTAAYGLRTPTHDAWTSGLESTLGAAFDGERSSVTQRLSVPCAATAGVLWVPRVWHTKNSPPKTTEVYYWFCLLMLQHATASVSYQRGKGLCQFRAGGVSPFCVRMYHARRTYAPVLLIWYVCPSYVLCHMILSSSAAVSAGVIFSRFNSIYCCYCCRCSLFFLRLSAFFRCCYFPRAYIRWRDSHRPLSQTHGSGPAPRPNARRVYTRRFGVRAVRYNKVTPLLTSRSVHTHVRSLISFHSAVDSSNICTSSVVNPSVGITQHPLFFFTAVFLLISSGGCFPNTNTNSCSNSNSNSQLQLNQ